MNMNHKLKIALDMGPLAVFFVAYRVSGVFPATIAIMVATLVSLGVTYWLEKKIAVMPLISGIIITLFGTLTLVLHDDSFIKMKPTFVNLIFASMLLGGVIFNKSLLKYVLGSAIVLSEQGWRVLSIRWGLFFVFLAILNECIWRNFSTDFWVNFKVFGMFPMTILFTLSQLPLIKKHHQ